jgi:membrane associated rhomboid family serine protease
MRWVERYSVRHPRFGIENLMRVLIIGNAVVWLLTLMDRTGTVQYYLALNPQLILQGQIWRLVTFVFIPDTSGILGFLFLYFYYFIGTAMENEWGQAKFNLYFLTGMVFTILYAFIVYCFGCNMSIGASYIYLSMFFSFATYYPNQRVLFMYFIPIKIKWLAIVDALYFVYQIFRLGFPLCLLPVVATLNYLLFCGDLLIRDLNLRSPAQTRKTVNFRREAQRIHREQQNAPYRYKCAVCGRTDTEYPNLEFRYCSRCAGYHCFCSEHINNHIHFTE